MESLGLHVVMRQREHEGEWQSEREGEKDSDGVRERDRKETKPKRQKKATGDTFNTLPKQQNQSTEFKLSLRFSLYQM